jgi:hypothetical protein
MEIFTASLLGSEEVHGRLCGGEESQGPDSVGRSARTAGQVLPQAAHGGDPVLPLTQSPSQVGPWSLIEKGMQQLLSNRSTTAGIHHLACSS